MIEESRVQTSLSMILKVISTRFLLKQKRVIARGVVR
jgi:hypothetical protein